MQTSVAHKESPKTGWLQQADVPAPASAWIWLAVGAVLLLFANGADNISLAAWLAPVFVLRFVRLQKIRVWLPVVYLLRVSAFAFQFRGMVPIPGVAYYIFLAASGIPMVVPYLADRWLVPRLRGLVTTLVFPLTCVVLDFAGSQGPYGSWGSPAYSQYGNLALLQLLSVTGLAGINFLMAWCAAMCNWVWEEGLNSRQARSGAVVCGGSILLVILLGGARLALFPPSSPTVRVASISKRKVEPELSREVSNRMFAGRATSEDMGVIGRWAAAMDNDLLLRAEQEMKAGAKIVFWGETNAPVFKGEETALIARGAGVAAKYQAYLGMALGVWNAGKNPPFENKLVLIQPDGLVAWEYNKVRPVPGSEAAMQVRGDGKLRALDTPYGRLSSIICFDGDFPQLLAQVGVLRADLMLDPSNDWQAIDPWHTQMVSFRAIEQGVNLIRQTSQGLSAAFDYQGRRLAAMDHFQTADYAMVSEVPTKGVRTMYSRFGDWFAWACVVGLMTLIAKGLIGSGKAID